MSLGVRIAVFGAALFLLAVAGKVADRAPERKPASETWTAIRTENLPAGVRSLMADFAWMAAVQHYGAERQSHQSAHQPDFPLLEERIRSAIRSDPGFRAPAVHGALLLAEPPPLGPGRARSAAGLLSAWVRDHPEDADAALALGLVRLWHLQDPAGAAHVFARAARRSGAPDWFSALAARAFSEAGVRETARAIWRRMLGQATNERQRANARTHLAQLDALDEIDRLTPRIRDFERQTGRNVEGWTPLLAARVVERIPLDPTGVPYRLVEGTPVVSPDSPLAGLPGR